MAWKVYGALDPSWYEFRRDAGGTIYGPLPCKRWIPVKGEKRHKVSYKASPAYVGNSKRDDSGQNRQAIAYAEWLARRDGKTIPENASAIVCWQTLPSAYERTKSGRAVMRKLAMSVTWYVQSGDRYRSTTREPVLTIDIPNWSWEPAPAVEHVDDSPDTADLLLAA